MQEVLQDAATDDFYSVIEELILNDFSSNTDQVNQIMAWAFALYGYSDLQTTERLGIIEQALKIKKKIGTPWALITMAEACLDHAKINDYSAWVEEGSGGARYNGQYLYDSTINYDSEYHKKKISLFVPYAGGSSAVTTAEDDAATRMMNYYKRASNDVYDVFYPYLHPDLLGNLKAYYHLFENTNAYKVRDLSGNEIHGELQNAYCRDLTDYGQSLSSGYCFDFSQDADSVISVPGLNTSRFIEYDQAFSIFGIIYFDAVEGFGGEILVADSGSELSILGAGGVLNFEINDPVNSSSRKSSSSLATGWHSFCCTYDGSGTGAGMNMYIEGSLDNDVAASNTIGTFGSDDYFIGGSDAAGADHFEHKMQCLRFYSAELTAAQIASLDSNLLS